MALPLATWHVRCPHQPWPRALVDAAVGGGAAGTRRVQQLGGDGERRKMRNLIAGQTPQPPSSPCRRGRRTARAQQRRQWVEAKRGASDGRSGALRAAHRGSMMPVMMAAPSRGCSADSGDSSVKKAAAQPMDEHRIDGGRVGGLRTHIG